MFKWTDGNHANWLDCISVVCSSVIHERVNKWESGKVGNCENLVFSNIVLYPNLSNNCEILDFCTFEIIRKPANETPTFERPDQTVCCSSMVKTSKPTGKKLITDDLFINHLVHVRLWCGTGFTVLLLLILLNFCFIYICFKMNWIQKHFGFWKPF